MDRRAPRGTRFQFRFSEIGTEMTLLSALDDLVIRTLAVVPGRLQKLQYLAGLRGESGAYEHWGLEKVHGSEAARHALAEAHSSLFIELLRTPLGKIRAEGSFGASGSPLQGATSRMLVPGDLKGGSQRHFNSVLAALEALSRAKIRPAA